ncbi:MAG: AtpZ/AtpI family protein [Caulobacterales bacterium]|uniref:AtpZ/AtpI family protein n=1 Tax=Glycocaulis sp. TaxID=1969725 RepID=UPI003FA103DB
MSNPSDHTGPSGPDDFEQRLAEKLKARQAKADKDNAPPAGWSLGLRYGSEFFGGVVAGVFVGLLADHFFGWSPFGLLVGLVLGFAAGALNIVRAAKSMQN